MGHIENKVFGAIHDVGLSVEMGMVQWKCGQGVASETRRQGGSIHGGVITNTYKSRF